MHKLAACTAQGGGGKGHEGDGGEERGGASGFESGQRLGGGPEEVGEGRDGGKIVKSSYGGLNKYVPHFRLAGR